MYDSLFDEAVPRTTEFGEGRMEIVLGLIEIVSGLIEAVVGL
jgi:hypothetical protein